MNDGDVKLDRVTTLVQRRGRPASRPGLRARPASRRGEHARGQADGHVHPRLAADDRHVPEDGALAEREPSKAKITSAVVEFVAQRHPNRRGRRAERQGSAPGARARRSTSDVDQRRLEDAPTFISAAAVQEGVRAACNRTCGRPPKRGTCRTSQCAGRPTSATDGTAARAVQVRTASAPIATDVALDKGVDVDVIPPFPPSSTAAVAVVVRT